MLDNASTIILVEPLITMQGVVNSLMCVEGYYGCNLKNAFMLVLLEKYLVFKIPVCSIDSEYVSSTK